MKKQFLCCVLCKQHLLQSTPLKSTQLCKLKCFFTWGKHVQQDWVTWLKVVDVGLRTRCLIQNARGFPVTVGVPRRVQAAGILWLVWCSPRTSRASSFKSFYSSVGGILILRTGCSGILTLLSQVLPFFWGVLVRQQEWVLSQMWSGLSVTPARGRGTQEQDFKVSPELVLCQLWLHETLSQKTKQKQ